MSARFACTMAIALTACGSRSGLETPPRFDASMDVQSPMDAAHDVQRAMDVLDVHVMPDVPVVIDTPIVIDTPVFVDAPDVPVVSDVPQTCPDGGVITAYIWDASGNLYTFDPANLATHLLGIVNCNTTMSPWTLSVSRAGFAYLMYEDWHIYRVDLTTLACTPTPFDPTELGFDVAGDMSIAISRDPTAPEQLFVYGLSRSVPTLAVADLTHFVMTPVGTVTPDPMEFPFDMQGDAQGHLFALSDSGLLVEIDASNAHVLLREQTTFMGGDWAVMTYGRAVYFFGDGNVSLFDLPTGHLTPLGSVGVSVVGASAAPCIE